ncbi:MAG: hypothetical protein KBG38_07870 [Candidatus Cloacimonas sp.]|nr:hypothetical protein [Candidatus Cloacimonas sp.]
MTQIKNENRYGMNRINGISRIPNISSVRMTDTKDWFQPGDKKRTYKTIFIGGKSSVGTTDTNNGFLTR